MRGRIKVNCFITLSVIAMFTSSCEPRANISAPATGTVSGVSFQYPGNWKITDRFIEEDYFQLIFESSGGAVGGINFWAIVEGEEAMPIVENESARIDWKEIPLIGGSKPTFIELAPEENFERIDESSVMSFMGEKIEYRTFYAYRVEGEQSQLIWVRVAMEDSEKVKPGFDLILRSLNANR